MWFLGSPPHGAWWADGCAARSRPLQLLLLLLLLLLRFSRFYRDASPHAIIQSQYNIVHTRKQSKSKASNKARTRKREKGTVGFRVPFKFKVPVPGSTFPNGLCIICIILFLQYCILEPQPPCSALLCSALLPLPQKAKPNKAKKKKGGGHMASSCAACHPHATLVLAMY
jgi:hypothetical protein